MGEELTVELFDGKVAKVTKVSGYDDGYYRDYEILFRVDGVPYNANYRGSCSGWIKFYNEVVRDRAHATRLSGVDDEKLTYDFDSYDAVSRESIDGDVKHAYEDFIKSHAKERYEYFESEDDDAIFECHVDNKPRNPVNRGWLDKEVEDE